MRGRDGYPQEVTSNETVQVTLPELPHIPLYKPRYTSRGTNGLVHADRSCTPEEAQTETSLKDEVDNHLASRLCFKSRCFLALDTIEVSWVETLRRVATTRVPVHVGHDVQSDLNALVALGTYAPVLRARHQDDEGPLDPYVHEITKIILALHDDLLERMRTPRWRTRVQDTYAPAAKREVRARLGHDKSEAPGVLVTATSLSGQDRFVDAIITVLGESLGDTRLVEGPLDLLACLATGIMTNTIEPAGGRRGVVPRPVDWDHDLKETVLGLTDPGSAGPLGDLAATTVAARRVLGRPEPT